MNEQEFSQVEIDKASIFAKVTANRLINAKVSNMPVLIQRAIDKCKHPLELEIKQLKAEIEQLRSIAMGVNMDELHRLQQHVQVLRDVLSEVGECMCCDGKISKAMELTNPNP